MKTSGQGKAGQVEAIYEAIQARVSQKLVAATREAKAGDYLPYRTIWEWVCEATRELMQPTIFSEGEGIDQAIKEYGPEVYLDDIMRRVIFGEPPATLTLTRTPLTPEVLATLNSDPEAIYKRLFPTPPADIDTGLRIEELYLLIPPGITPPEIYRAERNSLTFPIAVLGKPTPGQNYISHTDKKTGIKTEAGTMYGVLTDFDFRGLHAIMAFTKRVTIKGMVIDGARFSHPGIAKYLGVKPGGKGRKRIAEMLKKLASFQITHNQFITREGIQDWTNQKVFDDSTHIKQAGDEAIDNLFIWKPGPGWGTNLRNYFELIDSNIFGQLGKTARPLYCYLLRAMGQKGTHQEAWENIADRLPITTGQRHRKKMIFEEACKELQTEAGITWKIDGKGIAHFTSHPKKTKEDHQAEALAEVSSRVKEIEQAKTQKEAEQKEVKRRMEAKGLNEEQNRTVATLMKLGVNYKIAGEIARENLLKMEIDGLIDAIEIDANIKYYMGKHDPDAEPEGPNQVAGRWFAEYRTAVYGFGKKNT